MFPLWKKTEMDLRNELDEARENTNTQIDKFDEYIEHIRNSAINGDIKDMENMLAKAYMHLNIYIFPRMNKQWIAALRVAKKTEWRKKPQNVLHDVYEDVGKLIGCYQMLNIWKSCLQQDTQFEMPTYKCLNDFKTALETYYPSSRKDNWLAHIIALLNSLHKDFK
ncbi:MAG: hypothetical protein Q4C88_02970 [Akkermansia sp.]|nr:hypothetical protein [Akkermansia sp.]